MCRAAFSEESPRPLPRASILHHFCRRPLGLKGVALGDPAAPARAAAPGKSAVPPGLSRTHDSLVYVLNRERHTVGQRTPSSKPSISLSAPDILPLHCTIRRRQPSGRAQAVAQLVLEPIPGAPVSVNFSEVGGRAVVLRHGDLLSLGLYYLLLLKDPAQAQPLPAQALARLRAVPESCRMCGAPLRARGASVSARPVHPRPRPLHLEFEPDAEDALLQRIMTLVEPGGDDHKLTPAFLLCLCIQHSATRLEPGSFGQLLLKMARMIRETVWEKTKELAEKQAHLVAVSTSVATTPGSSVSGRSRQSICETSGHDPPGSLLLALP
ncbi:hypothetical protein J1605_019506 [Eschrichtius robustus]|uniref:Ras and Rab interactor 1 n=1 Tax=Eschrichtius robustus TaxID=9764 RepID=A0AB34HIN8_ESCRO|nr:hypothetical protein J1605_019506 [Eschrichtius robustus]